MSPRRELLTGLAVGIVGGTIAMTIGLLLDWSNGELGVAVIVGTLATVLPWDFIWGPLSGRPSR
jgi:hypothetical protein